MNVKQVVQNLRPEIDAALAEIAKKHGVNLKCGRCTYDPTGNFTFKLEGVTEGGVTKEGALYNANAKWLGLPELGTVFAYRGQQHTITGMNTTGTKVIVKRSDNKEFLFKVEGIQRLCGNHPAGVNLKMVDRSEAA